MQESSSDSENSSTDDEDKKQSTDQHNSESEKSSNDIVEESTSKENIKGSNTSIRSEESVALDNGNTEDEDKEDANDDSIATSKSSNNSDSSSESSDSDTDSTSDDSEESDSSYHDNFSVLSNPSEKETTKITMERGLKRHKIRKRFTLPFFFNYIAWISCVGVIFVSVFYLWAYGVMFGNDKTYQWLTSLLAYFWSDLLIVEPLKVR